MDQSDHLRVSFVLTNNYSLSIIPQNKGNGIQSLQMATTVAKKNKVLLLFAFICFITAAAVAFDNDVDISLPVDCLLNIDEDSTVLLITDNHVPLIVFLTVSFFLQPQDPFHRILFIIRNFDTRAPPLFVPV